MGSFILFFLVVCIGLVNFIWLKKENLKIFNFLIFHPILPLLKATQDDNRTVIQLFAPIIGHIEQSIDQSL